MCGKIINRNKFLLENGCVTKCPRNVSKMNVFEYIWLFPEMENAFGRYKKTNIFLVILFLICPCINELYYYLFKSNIFDGSLADFITTIFIMFLTCIGVGPLFHVTLSCLNIKKQKKIIKNEAKRIKTKNK